MFVSFFFVVVVAYVHTRAHVRKVRSALETNRGGTEKMSATKESRTVKAFVNDESRKVGNSYYSQSLEFVCAFRDRVCAFRGRLRGDRRSRKY